MALNIPPDMIGLPDKMLQSYVTFRGICPHCSGTLANARDLDQQRTIQCEDCHRSPTDIVTPEVDGLFHHASGNSAVYHVVDRARLNWLDHQTPLVIYEQGQTDRPLGRNERKAHRAFVEKALMEKCATFLEGIERFKPCWHFDEDKDIPPYETRIVISVRLDMFVGEAPRFLSEGIQANECPSPLLNAAEAMVAAFYGPDCLPSKDYVGTVANLEHATRNERRRLGIPGVGLVHEEASNGL